MFLVGRGSIGKRYAAILNYLEIPFFSYDPIDYLPFSYEKRINKLDSTHIKNLSKEAIIATPTENHIETAEYLLNYGFEKLLIEKPMFLEEDDYYWADAQKADIRMVCNYHLLDGIYGDTVYNYYEQGKEQPWMNLFQIIGLAQGKIKINYDSPVWYCKLNGRELTLEDVHKSYIEMLKLWMSTPERLVTPMEALRWHRKCIEWQKLESGYKAVSAVKDSPTKSSTNSGKEKRS